MRIEVESCDHKVEIDSKVTKKIEPTQGNNYADVFIRKKPLKQSRPKKFQIDRAYNEIVDEDYEDLDNPLFPEVSPESQLALTNNEEEVDSTTNEVGNKHIARTHHYLYNITHDQGLDTIIYVPFLERILSGVSGRIYTVYPGTIWCGVGNQAQDESSIGYFSSTDRCCRDHDLCRDSIPPKAIKHGLRNPGFFTRSHCDCDRKFYRCLKFDNSFVSRKIGMAYFNILRPQCFRKEFPIMYCWIWFDGRCLNYVVDDTRAKSWQWFDNKPF
ncbi:phospholipase A2-like [Hermetia illucens]|uniref:phospholipase A2-like n=1 Tax=Hermetia illucens TaxID=343691 RepID=UPI0018CC1968|nr:phospholipase A2-like [Hermetia illucens]